MAHVVSQRRPPARGTAWVYPCVRPRSAAAYAARFPGRPEPFGEVAPAEDVRRAFSGLPALEGEAASRLEELASAVAGDALPALAEGRDLPALTEGRDLPAWVPAILAGAALIGALREAPIERSNSWPSQAVTKPFDAVPGPANRVGGSAGVAAARRAGSPGSDDPRR